MLYDQVCRRLRHTDTCDSDSVDLIDHDAEAVSDSIAMFTAKATIVRTDSTRLQRCPHCGSGSVYRWGKSDLGVPRGRCRACARTFSPRTGTWIAGIRETQKFAYVLDDMMTKVPGSCRRLASALEVDKMSVWHWRRKISQALLGPESAPSIAPVEIHDKPIRESRKGSREWVNHHHNPTRYPAPNRPRWVDVDRHGLPLPHSLVAYQLRVLISAAESGCQPLVAPLVCPSAARHICDACEAATRPGGAGAGRRSTMGLDDRHAENGVGPSAMDRSPAAAPPAPRDEWLVDRSAPKPCAVASRVKHGACEHRVRVEKATPATSTIGTANCVLHSLQQLNLAGLAAVFQAFLQPFAGPAAKYLEAYAAWFIKRLEGSDDGRLERAWKLLMA